MLLLPPLLSFIVVTISLPHHTAGWAYTAESCPSFSTCQDCVVEYARDSNVAFIRRPCTWCPSTGKCELMNHYTEYCQVGNTYRDTCPIRTEELPRCVDLSYSFWVCSNARPPDGQEADDAFVMDFCGSPQRLDHTVQLCNGDHSTLEYVQSGLGRRTAFVVSKNPYGVDFKLNYFWYGDYGEDRRRIETNFVETDKWLTNAQAKSTDQALALKYRILPEGSTTASATASATASETAISSSARLLRTTKAAGVLSLFSLAGSFVL